MCINSDELGKLENPALRWCRSQGTGIKTRSYARNEKAPTQREGANLSSVTTTARAPNTQSPTGRLAELYSEIIICEVLPTGTAILFQNGIFNGKLYITLTLIMLPTLLHAFPLASRSDVLLHVASYAHVVNPAEVLVATKYFTSREVLLALKPGYPIPSTYASKGLFVGSVVEENFVGFRPQLGNGVMFASLHEFGPRIAAYREASRAPLRLEPIGSAVDAGPGYVDGPADIHAVTNPTSLGEDAVSLHVYCRPYDECDIYDTERGAVRRVRLVYDSVPPHLAAAAAAQRPAAAGA